jgi:hypothetical protein
MGVAVFLITVIYLFPIGPIIDGQVVKQIHSLSLLRASNIKTEFFLPKVILEDVYMYSPTIAGTYFSKVILKWKGFAIFPLGVKLGIDARVGSSVLKSNFVLGFRRYRVDFDFNNLNLDDFKILGGKLNGHITAKGSLALFDNAEIPAGKDNLDISSGSFMAKSGDLGIIWDNNVGALSVNFSATDKNIQLKQLEMGGLNKDIHLKLMGQLKDEQLQLDGELFVNENGDLAMISAFIKSTGFLNVAKDGPYYKLKVDGLLQDIVDYFYVGPGSR